MMPRRGPFYVVPPEPLDLPRRRAMPMADEERGWLWEVVRILAWAFVVLCGGLVAWEVYRAMVWLWWVMKDLWP